LLEDNDGGAELRQHKQISKSSDARSARATFSRSDTPIAIGKALRSRKGLSLRSALVGRALVLVAVGALITAAPAIATPPLHLKEVFGSASQPTFVDPEALAVDQSNGDVLVMDRDARTISRWNPDGTPADFSALGTNVIDAEKGPGGKACAEEPSSCDAPNPPAPEGLVFGFAGEVQIAIDNSGTATDGDIYVTRKSPNVVYIFARSGKYLGELTEGGKGPFVEPCGVAVDKAGSVYVDDFLPTGGIQKFSPSANPAVDSDFLTSFPAPEKPCPLVAGVGATDGFLFVAKFGGSQENGALFKVDASSKAIAYEVAGKVLTDAIAPVSGNVFVARGKEVAEYDASGSTQAVEQSSFSLSGEPVQGLAVSPSGDDLYVSHGTKLEVLTELLAPTVTVGAATEVSPTSARLGGSVDPESVSVTGCKIEYGLAASETFEREASCDPSAAEIPVDSTAHAISAVVSGLQPASRYRFRVTAANANGTTSSSQATFSTLGPPRISAVLARDAGQGSVSLQATVEPTGLDTSYRFEWGSTAAYGNSLPVGSILAGEASRQVSASISGLSPGSLYHYRLVATNAEASVSSPDQVLETLDACGLPDHRCFELVSPRELGPTATPGNVENQREMHFQAAVAGDRLAYTIEGSLPNATRGGETLFLGIRGSEGWESSQLSPGIISRSEGRYESSNPSDIMAAAPDLSCDVVVSDQPLTSDPNARLVIENGGANLYRHNADGSYTLISNRTPDNPVLPQYQGFYEAEYQVIGMSNDCRHIVFSSPYHYPGIAGVGESRLYEWDEGTLKNIGIAPGPKGETPVEAVGGTQFDSLNAVSQDGSRAFFSATKLTAGNPTEVGTEGIFVRERGAVTRDVSESETETPDLGAVYQGATPDGAHVYFKANAGLTNAASSEGTDLYEYNLETSRLTDLSVVHAPGGAAVAGLVGFSEDGSRVYLAAQGQLQAGEGGTYAQNVSHETYAIYSIGGGSVSYVATITGENLAEGAVVKVSGTGFGSRELRSRVSPEGRYLLFESSEDVTGYDSGGSREAYLYDAQRGSQPTVCLSCRADGKASVTREALLPSVAGTQSPLDPPQSLVERDDSAEVFFVSADPLAPGAAEREYNLYEWVHDQVYLIARQPVGASEVPQRSVITFAGASADGHDLYFADAAALNWENQDERHAIWDARVGGGFTQLPAPSPCDPNAEASCQGPLAAGPQSPVAASAIFNGLGDVVSQLSKPSTSATRPLTRAQKLAKALKACRKYRQRAKRGTCERQARSKFATKHRAKGKPRTNAKRRKGGK
jgi:hypothetical protein